MFLATLMVMATAGVAVPAALSPLEPAFGNTVLSTYPDGRSSKLWLNRDGTFTAEERTHEAKGGHWSLNANRLCLSQTKPIPIPFLAYCTRVPSNGVASGWTGRAITGEPIAIRIVAGR